MNMNREKVITPCRKVGLSRKRNTPLKTVDNLLKENIVDKERKTPQTLKKSKESKKDNNIDTPCRQVGLSRKRKISTPVCISQKEEIVCTPPSRVFEEKYSHERKKEKAKPESSKTRNLNPDKLNSKRSKDVDQPNENVSASCAKKLAIFFPSQNAENDEQKGANIGKDTQFNQEIDRIASGLLKNSLCFTPKSDNEKSDIKNENSTDLKIEENETISVQNISDSENQIKPNVPDKLYFDSDAVNSNISSQNEINFIKVCYTAKKDEEINKDVKSQHEKNKFSHELFEDDDDFEIGPKKKRKFERSKTYDSEKEKRKRKIKLKKSLTVGDNRFRSKTDSSILRNISNADLTSDCFVKLEKIEDATHKPSSQEQSDDDFEISCTPKESKIKNLEILEKEVCEKRIIVEELQRAKMYKKLHSKEDLKQLTSRWKNGCIDALQDLLKQLNMHSYMNMAMLLKKLNIPEDFVPLSQ